MEIPRRLLEEALELMRQQRGNEALDIVRNYNITSFGQLENACRLAGLETWKSKDYELHKHVPDYWR